MELESTKVVSDKLRVGQASAHSKVAESSSREVACLEELQKSKDEQQSLKVEANK